MYACAAVGEHAAAKPRQSTAGQALGRGGRGQEGSVLGSVFLQSCPRAPSSLSPWLGPPARHEILTVVGVAHQARGVADRHTEELRQIDVSFVQRGAAPGWSVRGTWGRQNATVIRSGQEEEVGTGQRGGVESWHLSAVMIGSVCKHVLESVGFSEQESDLFVAPVYRGQVL